MKYIINLLLGIVFISCQENCRNEDTPPPPTFNFKIVNDSFENITNEGNYSIDSINLVGIRTNDSEYSPRLHSHGDYFYFGTNINCPLYLINYNNKTTDSVTLDYIVNATDYCEDVVTDFSIIINGIEKCENCSDSIIEIQK